MISIRYVKRINRETVFYDIGKIYCFNITKNIFYKIVWNKWLFNKRLIIIKFKQEPIL